MQLILTQSNTEDIQIKMSTQTENPVNGNIEIKEVNQGFKIEAIPVLEKSLSNKLETIKEIELKEEKSLVSNSNGNTTSIQEAVTNDNILQKNLNSIVSENIINRISCIQDGDELERKTQNPQMKNQGKFTADVTIDPKLNQLNSSSKNSECSQELEEKPDVGNTNEPFSENNISVYEHKNDSSVSVKPNVNSQESNEHINKPSEDIKKCSLDTEKLNDDTVHVELAVTDDKYNDDVVMNEEINAFDNPEIATNNKLITLVDTTVNNFPALDDEDVAMHEVDKVGNSEMEISPEIENLKLIEMEDEVMPRVQLSINQISPIISEAEDLKTDRMNENKLPLQSDVMITTETKLNAIDMNEEISLPVQACENQVLTDSENSKLVTIAKENSFSLQRIVIDENREKNHDATITETKTASVSVLEDNNDHLSDDAPELNLNKIQDEVSTKTCDSNEELDNSKDIDDTETVNKDEDNVENVPGIENNGTSSEVINDCAIVKVTTEPKDVITEITAEHTISENIITSRLDSEVKDKKESNKSAEVSLEKDATQNILAIKNQECSEKPLTLENTNQSNDSSIEKEVKDLIKEDTENVEIIDEEDVKIVDLDVDTTNTRSKENSTETQETNSLPVVCKLSNTLDILSDDEEESSEEVSEVSDEVTNKSQNSPEERQCINIDDDDDIMLIEEDTNSKDKPEELSNNEEVEQKPCDRIDVETGEKHSTDITDLIPKTNEKDLSPDNKSSMELDSVPDKANKSQVEDKNAETKKPLLPQNFLKTAKKNLAGMTRHELEDFCILRIVESIVDRSNLSDIKTKMKTMAQNLDDFKKRVMMMTKQNRDLQVVLKSVQEEQKRRTNAPIQPLKITRSVGMQVLMNDKLDPRRKPPIPNPVPTSTAGPTGRPVRAVQIAKQIKTPVTPQNIPVPRKVPVNNSPAKILTNTPANNLGNKSTNPSPNGIRNPSPVQKVAEKRPHSRIQTSSVTVDLTDDEPPSKICNSKNGPSQPVRVVPPQNLLAQQRQFPPINNARKVYIPISGPQAQQIRAGQTIVMKNMVNAGPRPGLRVPMPRPQQSPVRPKQSLPNRHPAPLPESMKQYTPSTWKALPPAPDLKLSKVENGIVISWKIDGYPEGGYETIASYQLYAYQETTAPPCTALWKKIGDVKALPLPMACTLTQFMAGFKYYFAVRAVDVRSRLGPFSLPGSILLLNKV